MSRLSVSCAAMFLLCPGLLAGPPNPVSKEEPADLRRSLAALARPWVESEQVTGLSIGVIRDDESATIHLGRVAVSGNVPNDDTVYEIGSVSKVFTGILIADAVLQGLVTLDQPAQTLLPGSVSMPRGRRRSVTIGHLATHRSGLPRIAGNMPMTDLQNPYADYTSDLAYEFLEDCQLESEPGDAKAYSNFGMALAGYLITRNSGHSYDELLTDRITRPLGMNSTSVTLSDTMQERLATPHRSAGVPVATWDFADMPGSGGIRSSTADMLRFAAGNLHPPDDGVGQALQFALRNQLTNEKEEDKIGLGWNFARDGSTRWHNGQTGGSHSMLLVNPRKKHAVVLLSNTACSELDRLAFDILRMLGGRSVKPRTFDRQQEVSKDILQRYVGRYTLTPEHVFTVTTENGHLFVRLSGQSALRVYPRSETEWFYKSVKASITFQVDKGGRCRSLTLHQNGLRQKARKTE